MKKFGLIALILLVSAIFLCSCANNITAENNIPSSTSAPSASKDTADENTVIAKITGNDGEENLIYKRDLDNYVQNYIENYDNDFYNGKTADQVNEFYDMIVENFVNSRVQTMMVNDLGYVDKLSDEEIKSAEEKVNAEKEARYEYFYDQAIYDFFYDMAKTSDPGGDDQSWDSFAQQNVNTYDESNSQYTKEVEQKADELVADYVKESGQDDKYLKNYYLETAAMDKMYEDVTKDIKVTEQDIKDKYDEYVENDKEYYTENPNMFETDYPSGALYYNLGGYRVAKHILIKFDDEYSDKIKEYEENNDTANAEKTKKEAFASIQKEAEDILAKCKEKDADFDALVEEYSEDGGKVTYPDGYIVGKDSTQYDEDFRDAVWALDGVGSISGLVKTQFGYHIIKVIDELEEGPVNYDDVKEKIEKALIEYKKSEKYNNYCNDYKEENCKIEYFAGSYHVKDDEQESASASPSASSGADGSQKLQYAEK